MENKQRPIAIVKPMERDPEVVAMEEKVRVLARLVLQRRNDQQKMENLQYRWETRSLGNAMKPELEALNRHIKEQMDDFWWTLRRMDPTTGKYRDFCACYQEFLVIQVQDEARSGLERIPYFELETNNESTFV